MVLTPVHDMGYARIGLRLSENKILVYVMSSPTALRACKVNPLPFTQKIFIRPIPETFGCVYPYDFILIFSTTFL